MKNQSRQNNTRVNEIEESVGETWEETEEKVKEAVKAKLGMDLEIERAHGVERRKRSQGSAEKPRTTVCRLRNWKQKEWCYCIFIGVSLTAFYDYFVFLIQGVGPRRAYLTLTLIMHVSICIYSTGNFPTLILASR